MRLRTKLLNDRRGATGIEYALIASVISVAAIVAFENLGGTIGSRYSTVDRALAAKL